MKHETQLLRVLGVGFAIAVAIGGSVGQGIMRSPGIVAEAMVTPLAILGIWLLGGVLSAIDACAMAEVAASHPCSGGSYSFVRRAFGRRASMLTGWADSLALILALAFIAYVFGEYLPRLGIGQGVSPGTLAALLLAGCFVLNITGTRLAGGSQVAVTLVKAVLLTGLVALLFLAPGADEPGREVLPAATLPASVTFAGIVVAARMTIGTYIGWQNSAYFCEEIDRPEKSVARALFGGIAAITVLYLLINMALLHALTPAEMAASDLPAAEALGKTYGPTGALLVAAIAVISLAGIANVTTMITARILHAMARDGVLPRTLGKVHPNGAPRPAVALTVAGALVFALTGTYETLITTTVILSQSLFLVIDLSAIRLRRVEPDLPRPFRMPLYPLPALLGAALNAALVVAMLIEDPVNSLTGIFVLAGIGVVHVAATRLSRRTAASPA